MKPGTKRLSATFAYAAWCVVYAIEHGGNSPTLHEIADHFGVQLSTAQRAVECMLKHGIARREDNKLVIVGSTVVPPQWYIDNVPPPVSRTSQLENARHTNRRISVSMQS